MRNKYVKFHVKISSGCEENGKKSLGDTFLPHTVVSFANVHALCYKTDFRQLQSAANLTASARSNLNVYALRR